ncbi:hypothetical protein H4I96_10733 [Botrytis cinerea]
MDEFAQSRGDDDLFADEFEPASEPTVIEEAPIQSVSKLSPTAEAYVQSNGAQSLPTGPSNSNHHNNNKTQRERGADRRRGGRGRGGAPNNGLKSSRYATQEPEPVAIQPQSVEPTTEQLPVAAPSISPPLQSPTEAQPQTQQKPIPSVRGDRSLTGGPSHKKLTEEELTAKLERMKIINAEKAESFRKSEKDREGYAAKEKEEKRKRKEEIERGKVMEGERMRNRERKLKAMGGREWDEGKDEKDFEDNKGRSSQYVRGGHGGVIGGRGGLASSRFNDTQKMICLRTFMMRTEVGADVEEEEEGVMVEVEGEVQHSKFKLYPHQRISPHYRLPQPPKIRHRASILHWSELATGLMRWLPH